MKVTVTLGFARFLPFVAAVFAAASIARGQWALEASAVYSLTFREIDRVTGALSFATPGAIDPTEAVRVTLGIHFGPAVGATTPYWPANPPPGVGTVAGWGATNLSLTGIGGTAGTFASFTSAPGFQLTMPWPTLNGLDAFGAFNPEIILGQPHPNPANPISDFIAFTWLPSDYTARVVSFSVLGIGETPHRIGLLVSPPGGPAFTMSANVSEGGVSYEGTGAIVIVPSPAGGGPLLMAAAALAIRKRRNGGGARLTSPPSPT